MNIIKRILHGFRCYKIQKSSNGYIILYRYIWNDLDDWKQLDKYTEYEDYEEAINKINKYIK